MNNLKVTPPPPAEFSGIILALAALILLPACWGGSAGNSAGSLTSSAPAPAITPTDDMMPPVVQPMDDDRLMSQTLTGFPTSSTGGIARAATETITDSNGMASSETVTASAADPANDALTFDATTGQLQLDGEEAVLLVITDTDINALLQAPLRTQLLLDDGFVNYAATDANGNRQPTGNGRDLRAIMAHSTDNNLTSGRLFERQVDGTSTNTLAYFDSHAPVVLGYESQDSRRNVEFTMIGEPFRMPTTMDDFSGTWSGFAIAARRTFFGRLVDDTSFSLRVDVTAGVPTIGNFSAVFTDVNDMTQGSVSASDIAIDTDHGTFSGAATFDDSIGTGVVIHENGPGHLLGQFHGTDAAGVTGAFHNGSDTQAPSIFGAFAGSKETPAATP